MTRNYEYEIYLVAMGLAKGDIAKLRREQQEASPDPFAGPEPPRSKAKSKRKPPWIRNITEQMITRARGRPPANTAHRGDLLGPSQSISMSDRFGGTGYADHLNRGGKSR